MNSHAFVDELQAASSALLEKIGDVEVVSTSEAKTDLVRLLQIALVNEINVSELAAAWMPGTQEIDVKLGMARQAGDEAKHFQLVGKRLEAHGFSLDEFIRPDESPLFAYLRSLPTTVERIAAGQFTLESIAYRVNRNFMKYCEVSGDEETVRLYENVIQPEELHHQKLGRTLLEKYALTPEAQQRAREAATKTLQLSAELRAGAAEKIGTACLPGC